MNKKKTNIIIIVVLAISFFLTISIDWLYNNFGSPSMEEIVFQLKVPLKGTSTDMIWKYFIQCPWKIIVLTTIISIILIKKNDLKFKKLNVSLTIANVILALSLGQVLYETNIIGYLYNQINDSPLIGQEYVNPKDVVVEFPEQKRNLIYIFLESMETTFYSVEDGGLAEQDLIPEISQLAKDNLNFSETSQLGGAYTPTGTTWTIAAMTSHTCGIPLKIGIEDNALSEYSTFLDGAYSMGEILDKNGYNNFLLLGSDAVFGGRKNLFEQHGNYEIWDLNSALEEKRIDKKIWWGYSDRNLFQFAKEKILNLSQKDEPFNFTMLTVDTHFQDGYKCELCPDKWDEQYENVLSCSSNQVGSFIEWIKQQDFYENTTIVISGDHLTMQSGFFDLKENEDYDKKVVNVIINPAIEPTTTKRAYSTMDLYPTTLAALGVTIEGNKLGLGVNLFSEELTLIERYGFDYIDREFKKVSKFYDNNILVSE